MKMTFLQKKNQNDNYYDIKMNKCVEKRGIQIPITRCIRNVTAQPF